MLKWYMCTTFSIPHWLKVENSKSNTQQNYLYVRDSRLCQKFHLLCILPNEGEDDILDSLKYPWSQYKW